MAVSISLSDSKPGTNSVYISCSASGYALPESESPPAWNPGSPPSGLDTTIYTKTVTRSWISYKGDDGNSTTWEWTFNYTGSSSEKSPPSVRISGLTAGAKNNIKGTLHVERTSKKITETGTATWSRSVSTDDEGNKTYGPWQYKGVSNIRKSSTAGKTYVYPDATSNTLSVYTKPSNFIWYIATNGYISNYISASKWNALCDQAGKYLSWRDQENRYTAANGAKTSSGQPISETTYMTLSRLLNGPTVYANQTYIKASHFTDLVDKVNGS